MTDDDRSHQARMRLASEFKRLRRHAKLSQAQAGEFLGISHQQIGKYEREKSDIPAFRMDIARGGFKPEGTPDSGFSEDNAYYAPPSDQIQMLRTRLLQVKDQCEQLVRVMDDVLGV